MKVLGIIPARAGSKGVPGKNVRYLGEMPLLAYTALAADRSKMLSKTILSTDDALIQEVGLTYKMEIPFTRPDHLATDTASSISVVQHALEFMESK